MSAYQRGLEAPKSPDNTRVDRGIFIAILTGLATGLGSAIANALTLRTRR